MAEARQTEMKFFCNRGFGTCLRRQSDTVRAGSGKFALWSAALLVMASAVGACSSQKPQLSVKLYNPKTDQTLFCSASHQMSNTYSEILASAVESCAKQLEAQGFVREE